MPESFPRIGGVRPGLPKELAGREAKAPPGLGGRGGHYAQGGSGMKTRAAILYEAQRPLEVEEVDLAEHAVVHQEQLLPIPKEIPLDRAALVGGCVMTGIGAVVNTAKVEPGSNVVVIGCGGVGLNVVQGARMVNAGRIIAVDLLDNKLQYACQFGATDAINARREDPVERIKELTGGGADYAFAAIGGARTAEPAFESIR